MKKWFRRILLLIATMMVVLLGGVMLAVWLVRSDPNYYRAAPLTPEQAAAAAHSAEEKIIRIQNQAARIEAASHAATRKISGSAIIPSALNEPVTIVFTTAELNSLFDKWSNFQNLRGKLDRYITDPELALRDGRLILVANLKHPNLVISLHFDASIDENSQLKLQLARVMGGRLPLPEAVIGSYEQQLANQVSAHISDWQKLAKIDSHGAANSSAIGASTGKLLAHMLRHEPAEPVLFLPVVQGGSVPVKILAVKIENDTIALTVRPMTRDEQDALLERIRGNDPAVAELGTR